MVSPSIEPLELLAELAVVLLPLLVAFTWVVMTVTWFDGRTVG
jgi:hypothetical protein